jgi:hypothetical protein
MPYAVRLAKRAEMLFGSKWAAGCARLTGVDPRTMLRIQAAAREGRDYPGAAHAYELFCVHINAVYDSIWLRPPRRRKPSQANPVRRLSPEEVAQWKVDHGED